MASQVPRHDLWCASPTPSLWRCCCGEAHKFTDRTFPPNDKLLGREHADIGEVEWILVGTQEHRGAIQRLFLNKQANPRGKYRLWLFDVHKALAKFCGSYANIESGQVVWAFQATTGDAVAAYIQDSKGNWEHMKVTADEEHDHHKRAIQLYHTGNILNPDKMFKLLCKFERAQAVLCASSRGIDNTLNDGRGSFEGGIVAGHAYSIISAAEKRGQKLLRLRNPWGTFEFKGKRSDKDDAWVANPDVARAFGYKEDSDDNDGAFFIAWDDFCKFFDHIDVCLRTRGMSEFILEINEDFGGCGAAFGCLKGIFYFMCLCIGLWIMWCGVESSSQAIYDWEKGLAHRPTH